MHSSIKAQSFVFQYEPESKHLNIKWYTQQLIYPEGVLLHRKLGKSDWKPLSIVPVIPKQSTIDQQVLNQDSALAELVTILKEGNNTTTPSPLMNLNFMVKSFHSLPLAKYIGVYFKDTTVIKHQLYRYKITTLDGKDLLVSDPIFPDEQVTVATPENLLLKRLGRRVSVSWKHELGKFYAVDVFSKYPEDSTFIKRNSLPVIPSETDGGTRYFSERIKKQKGTYQYKIRGIDFWGEKSSFSAIESFSLAKSELVQAAYNLKVDTLIGNTVLLKWSHDDPASIFDYGLYHKTKVNNEWKLFQNETINADQKELTLFDLEDGDHYFSVAALNKDGDPNHSNTTLAVIEDITPPEQIIGLNGIFEKRTVKLSWENSTAPDFEGYLIYRSFNDKDYLLVDADGQVETEFTESFDKQIKSSIWYKIVARDSSYNNSTYSEAIKLKIKDEYPPQVPVIKTVRTEKGKNSIYWLANAEPDLQGYYIQRCADTKCKLLNKGAIYKGTSFSDSLKIEEGKVSYQIKAVDNAGNESEFSTLFVVKNLVSQSLKQNIRLKVKKRRKLYKLSWKYEEKENKPVALFIVTDTSKERIDNNSQSFTLNKNIEEIYIKAYYNNGQIIQSNQWIKK